MAGHLNRRYNEVTYLTTHNSFASKDTGWIFAQQTYSIREQLERGVRAFMLDIHEYDNDIHLCHGSCDPITSRLQNPGDLVALHEILQEIKTHLDTFPEAVITLLFESRVTNRARLRQQFEASNTLDYIFYADRENVTPTSSWDVEHQGWPQLAWMVENNKRLVVFSDHKSGDDGLPYFWNFAVENFFGDKGLFDETKWIESRPESSQLTDSTKPLMLLNYFPTFDLLSGVLPDTGRYDSINNYYRILTQTYDCFRVSERLPNFISFDYFERGKNGGPVRAVYKINRERGNQLPRYREHPVLWRVNQKYDSGTRPDIATHPDGALIEVHQSQYEPTLWYHVGVAYENVVRWGASHQYAPGMRPAVAAHPEGWVVAVHEGERGETLWYMVGWLNNDEIEWGPAQQYDDGVSPDVAVHPDGWIIEVHQSENHERLWYHIGKIDGERIRWSKSREYDTGIQPAVAVHPSGR
ncbi:MAG: hypothetical protein D6737_01655, partial [Chloroflexi bacterium]